MKPISLIGILLIAFGIVSLSYAGFRYTTREKAVDLGPIQVTTERTRTIPFSPLLGGLSIVVGAVLLTQSKHKLFG